MTINQRKILVLVDGSERSMQTVHYVGKFLPPADLHVVLFHVFDRLPEYCWDVQNEAQNMLLEIPLGSWERQKKNNIDEFMEKAKTLLTDCGFDDTAVEIKIQNRQQGISRDILKEAEDGYCAVVLRRRGFSALESIAVGSVANKLLAKLSFIPLIITGQFPPIKKMLLAIDGSEASVKVAEFVGEFLAGSSCEIVLFNVIRSYGSFIADFPDLMVVEERLEMAKAEIELLFSDLKEKLVSAGFDRRKISSKTVTGEFSRAGAIVREATKGGFGAIVVGRRGISKIEAFFMGRVSNKVIHGGRHHTVWVI